MFSLIGLKRIIFKSVFQRVFTVIPRLSAGSLQCV